MLSSEGQAIGTLCIIDTESRIFDETQIKALQDLAKIAEEEINTTELNKALSRLRRAEENYRGIFENVAEGIFQIDPQGRYMNANPAVAHLYGYGVTEEFMAVVWAERATSAVALRMIDRTDHTAEAPRETPRTRTVSPSRVRRGRAAMLAGLLTRPG